MKRFFIYIYLMGLNVGEAHAFGPMSKREAEVIAEKMADILSGCGITRLSSEDEDPEDEGLWCRINVTEMEGTVHDAIAWAESIGEECNRE